MTERWIDETLDRFAATVATAIQANNDAIAVSIQANNDAIAAGLSFWVMRKWRLSWSSILLD